MHNNMRLFSLVAASLFCLGQILSADTTTPVAINFYGKVIDENNAPVSGATVTFNVTSLGDPYDQSGVSQATSDAQGLFSLTGKTGLTISVGVTKTGYYTPMAEMQKTWLPTADNATALPTQASPAVFDLRTKGVAEPLKVISISSISQPTDGTAKQINMLTGKVDATAGQITFQVTADKAHPDSSGHFDWQYTITVTGGGLQPRTGEFDFTAPSSGYQSSVTVSLPVSLGTAWAGASQKQYFIKLANGQYLRGEFIVNSGNSATDLPFWSFSGYLNPTGSANLEWDPTKVAP